jgi:hypothetical protein
LGPTIASNLILGDQLLGGGGGLIGLAGVVLHHQFHLHLFLADLQTARRVDFLDRHFGGVAQDAPTAGISPVSSAMTPSLIVFSAPHAVTPNDISTENASRDNVFLISFLLPKRLIDPIFRRSDPAQQLMNFRRLRSMSIAGSATPVAQSITVTLWLPTLAR